jgi:hypothetical protein
MINRFKNEHAEQLADILSFSIEDLDANRRGFLTDAQISRLQWDLRRQYWPSLIAWSLLGAIIGSLALTNYTQAPLWIVPLLVVLALAGFIAYDFRSSRRHLAAEGVVKSVNLTIPKDWKPLRRLGRIEFQTSGRAFTAPRELQDMLKPNRVYRVFFTSEVISFPVAGIRMKATPGAFQRESSGGMRILSIEPIGKE